MLEEDQTHNMTHLHSHSLEMTQSALIVLKNVCARVHGPTRLGHGRCRQSLSALKTGSVYILVTF